jgi:hypothetical protein
MRTRGADAIEFNIPGTEVKTISPVAALPDITDMVAIDGYTQPGTEKNTLAKGTNAVLKIELNGENAGNAAGLEFNPPSGKTAAGSVVRGLSINRFDAAGILLQGGVRTSNLRIEGNFLGTDPGGTEALGNGDGVNYFAAVDSTIGGSTPDKRNLISGNGGAGISAGNFSARASIEGNLIGTQKDGISALGNGVAGVFTSFGGQSQGNPNHVVGGGTAAAANTIAFNGGDGVGIFVCQRNPVTGAQSCGDGISVLVNSIFSNGGLGIDLEGGTEDADGHTANDPGDLDDRTDGSNLLQNFPVLTSAKTASGKTTIKGKLNSTPNFSFTVRFFSNPKGTDEGKVFIGKKSGTTDANGNASFIFAPAKAVSVGRAITATATDPGGNTSEFSAPRAVVAG